MKKNFLKRLLVLTLVLTLCTATMISGTLAAYTTTESGTASVTVANWSFEVSEADITADGTFTVDLFDTVNNVTGGVADIAEGTIAPGTTGSFELVFDNTSDVAAIVTVDFVGTDLAGVPIAFTIDGDTFEAASDDFATTDAVTYEIAYDGAAETCTIAWTWAEDDDDDVDTAFGTADELATPKVVINVTATQDTSSTATGD